MKLDWDNEKNDWLKIERKIGFEDIAVALEQGGLIDLKDHPHQDKYPNQKIMVVSWAGYIYLVPCVIMKDGYFLKTIFPSRKAKRDYTERNE
ncbi:MAG: toxin [Candidatus Omnitrophica bacterium]|nr:toxin [Candidatus Omnitrophota bacterium]